MLPLTSWTILLYHIISKPSYWSYQLRQRAPPCGGYTPLIFSQTTGIQGRPYHTMVGKSADVLSVGSY